MCQENFASSRWNLLEKFQTISWEFIKNEASSLDDMKVDFVSSLSHTYWHVLMLNYAALNYKHQRWRYYIVIYTNLMKNLMMYEVNMCDTWESKFNKSFWDLFKSDVMFKVRNFWLKFRLYLKTKIYSKSSREYQEWHEKKMKFPSCLTSWWYCNTEFNITSLRMMTMKADNISCNAI